MTEITCETKKWGGSLGIIIPEQIVQQHNIKVGEEITVDIKKEHLAKEFFGILSDWKKTPQQLKDEARKGWD